MKYEVIVGFDDSCGDVVTHRAFFSILDKYAGGIGSGHSDGTSSIEVSNYRLPNLKRYLNDAGIKLIRIQKL